MRAKTIKRTLTSILKTVFKSFYVKKIVLPQSRIEFPLFVSFFPFFLESVFVNLSQGDQFQSEEDVKKRILNLKKNSKAKLSK